MKNFANHTFLTKSISIVLVVTSVIGLVTWVIYLLGDTLSSIVGNAYSFFYNLLLLSLILLGLVSGIALWRKKVWPLKVAPIYFAIQLIGIGGQGFIWYPYIGFEMNLQFSLGSYWIVLNFFALVMLILTLLAYKQIREASQDAAEEPDIDTVSRLA